MNYKERIISGSFANFPDIKIEFGYNGIEAVIVYNDITFCEPVTVMLTGKVSMVYHNSELAYVRYYDIPVIDRFLDNLSAKDYVGSLTFGADPELEIVDSNNVCRDASKILGIDVARPDDIIGVDGHTSTAEIRPRPGTALEVVDNISYIIESLANNYGEYYWRVGSDFEACGGHVHIGFKHSSFISQVGNNITYLLDMVWGERVRKLAGVARRYTRYNCNGAWRRQNWGIEYRTPSASWLHNRQLTESVIEFTKVVMEKLFTSGVIIPRSRLIKKELQALFGKELVNKFFAGIRQYKASNKDVIDGWGIERKPSIWCIQYVGDWDIERCASFWHIVTTHIMVVVKHSYSLNNNVVAVSDCAVEYVRKHLPCFYVKSIQSERNMVVFYVSSEITNSIYRWKFTNLLYAVAEYIENELEYELIVY